MTTNNSTVAASKRRIVSLPLDLFILILSFLPIKEAARTSILSKEWQYLWRHACNVNLSEECKPQSICARTENSTKTMKNYKKIVSSLLSQNWKKFCIDFSVPCMHIEELNDLIDFGMKRRVQELFLNFSNRSLVSCYTVPRSSFSTDLRRLELVQCTLPLLPASTHLPHLTTLILRRSLFKATTFHRLIPASLILEDVEIIDCIFMGQIVFDGQSRALKKLRIRIEGEALTDQSEMRIVVTAPALELLEIGGGIAKHLYLISNLVSLKEANIDLSGFVDCMVKAKLVAALLHVKKLTLCHNNTDPVSSHAKMIKAGLSYELIESIN